MDRKIATRMERRATMYDKIKNDADIKTIANVTNIWEALPCKIVKWWDKERQKVLKILGYFD